MAGMCGCRMAGSPSEALELSGKEFQKLSNQVTGGLKQLFFNFNNVKDQVGCAPGLEAKIPPLQAPTGARCFVASGDTSTLSSLERWAQVSARDAPET